MRVDATALARFDGWVRALFLTGVVLLFNPVPSPAAAAPDNPPADPAATVVLPVGAGEAVSLPGPPSSWRQTAGPPVVGAELEGFTTWRLFAPGLYRFEWIPGPTEPTAIRSAAWRVFPGKTEVLGNRRPRVALPARADAQAGHPLQIAALRPHDDDQDPLTYRFRVLKIEPPDLDCRLYTRDSLDQCVLEVNAPGRVTVECRVHDGQMFSHPVLLQLVVGGRAAGHPGPTDRDEFAQPVSIYAVGRPFDECMDACSKQAQIPIVFQAGFAGRRQTLTLAADKLPFLRLLDLVAWQTGAQYRLDLLPGDGAPDRTAVVWLNGWDELRREPLVVGDVGVSDFSAESDGRDIAPRLNDIVREALAAQPHARCNLHGVDTDLGAALYLPRSAHDRMLAALQALNRPQPPRGDRSADAELRALRLKLELQEIALEPAAATPCWELLPKLSAATGAHWLINPRDLVVGVTDDPDQPAPALRACPITLPADRQPAAQVVERLLAQVNAARQAAQPGAPPLTAVCWTPHCWLFTAEPPLPEFSDRRPGPGQWLWQSAAVQAYDLTAILGATRITGEAIEHRIRTQFAAEFRDPAAHLSWWPRKKALLVIHRPAVQAAVAEALAALPTEEPSPLHETAPR